MVGLKNGLLFSKMMCKIQDKIQSMSETNPFKSKPNYKENPISIPLIGIRFNAPYIIAYAIFRSGSIKT